MSIVTLARPRSASRRSATNSMYCFIRQQFIPIRSTGRASVKNSCESKCIAICRMKRFHSALCHSPLTSANLLNANGFGDDVLHAILRWLPHQVAVHQAGKVAVQALGGEWKDGMKHDERGERGGRRNQRGPYLVPADQLVGIGQTRHETPFLQPIDGGERAGEEDALHCGKRNKTLPWRAKQRHQIPAKEL